MQIVYITELKVNVWSTIKNSKFHCDFAMGALSMLEISARTSNDFSRLDATTLNTISANFAVNQQISRRPFGHHLRLLDMDGPDAEARRRWLQKVVNVEQVYELGMGDTCYLAQASATFSLLLFSGSDTTELASHLRSVRGTLPSKILVPLLSWNCREDAARLLMAGADDVLHKDMDTSEAKLRLLSLLHRRKWRSTRSRNHAARNRECQLASIATRFELSAKEAEVLESLLNGRDKVVPYAQFVSKSLLDSDKGHKGLALIVHRLRSKLGTDWVIRNVRGKGYFLERKNSQ